MTAGLISLQSVIGAVYALKFVWLLVHGANCWLIYSLLKNESRAARYGLFLFGCHPLVLLELVANGHNDGLMIVFCLAALHALQRERSYAAVWLALVAVLVKSPALIFFAAILVYLAKRGEWRAVSRAVVASLIAVVTLTWIPFPNLESRLALIDFVPFANTSSVHSVLIDAVGVLLRRLSLPVAPEVLFAVERSLFSVLFAAFGVWRLAHVRDADSLVREVAIVWLGLMVGYAAMFYPWYVTWLVPLAALAGSAPLRRVITVYSFTVLTLYALPAIVALRSARQSLWASFRVGIAHFVPLAFWQRGTLR